MAETNTRGYEEIVDTLSDAVKVEMSIREKLSDGTNIIEAMQIALETYPKVQEAIEDFPNFRAELFDLVVDEAPGVQSALAGKLSDEERSRSRVFRGVTFATEGYQNQASVRALIEQQINLFKWIIAPE